MMPAPTTTTSTLVAFTPPMIAQEGGG